MALMWFASATVAHAGCDEIVMGSMDLRFEGNHPMVEASINGHPADVLLDTGAARTLALGRAASALGATFLSGNSEAAYGVGGRSETRLVDLGSVSIGGVDGGDMRLPALLSYDEHISAAILLGADFMFSSMDVELNVRRRIVKFLRHRNCDNVLLRDSSWISLERPETYDKRPTFIVSVNGKDVRAIIDTGAPISLLDRETAMSIGINPSGDVGLQGGVGSNRLQASYAVVDSIALGPEKILGVKLGIVDLTIGLGGFSTTFQPKMLLGEDFLRAHDILLSPQQRRLYFKYLGGEIFAFDTPAEKQNPYGDEDFIADANGCRFFNRFPRPNETIVWRGACKDGFGDGSGQLQWYSDGKPTNLIEATFVRGNTVGEFKSTSADGSVYVGGWLDGRHQGNGTLKASNGYTYTGQWSHGRRSGRGVEHYPDGRVYEGEFAYGLWNGHGVLTFKNGDRYDGSFRGGRMTTPDALTHAQPPAPAAQSDH